MSYESGSCLSFIALYSAITARITRWETRRNRKIIRYMVQHLLRPIARHPRSLQYRRQVRKVEYPNPNPSSKLLIHYSEPPLPLLKYLQRYVQLYPTELTLSHVSQLEPPGFHSHIPPVFHRIYADLGIY